jgi:uncharacterized protein YdeI (YjbR/CyaY-like superfamily)
MARGFPQKGNSVSRSFRAKLEPLHGNGLNWTIARLPFPAEKVWGVRGMLRVRVRVEEVEFPTSLFPVRSGGHFILVNKKIQKAAGIRLGDEATFTVTPDLAPREVKLSSELERALGQDRSLRKWFDRLSYSVRKWLADLVDAAKSAEARLKRADRIAEQVMEAMDAENELPPLLRLTFSRIPGAERAWKNMTDIQRRNNLLAVFYYRTPQSRIKRIQRIFESRADG